MCHTFLELHIRLSLTENQIKSNQAFMFNRMAFFFLHLTSKQKTILLKYAWLPRSCGGNQQHVYVLEMAYIHFFPFLCLSFSNFLYVCLFANVFIDLFLKHFAVSAQEATFWLQIILTENQHRNYLPTLSMHW